MKSIIHTFLTIAILAIAIPLQAQSNNSLNKLNTVFDNLVKSLSSNIRSMSSETYNIGYYKTYTFVFDSPTNRDIEKFNAALNDASTNAYTSMVKLANSGSSETQSIGFGNNNEKTWVFGSHSDYNYNLQMIRDPEYRDNRYVFVLVWHVEQKQLHATIHKFYSLDPQRQRESGSVSGIDMSPRSSSAFLDQYTKLSTIFSTNASRYANMKKILPDGVMSSYHSNQLNEISTLCAAAAGKIVTLCKEKSQLLDRDDRQVVTDDINKLVTQCPSDLDLCAALLKRAQKALR